MAMLNRQARSIRMRALTALVAVATLLLAVSAHAIHEAERALFGPIGVTRGEVVRVSVYGVQDPNLIPNPNDAPWDFVARFFNARGDLVHELRLQLAPGVTDVVIGNREDFPPDAFGRRTLRAEVAGFNPQPDPPGIYFATLEVFGLLTGRTHAFIPNLNEVPNTGR
jgi:hypothetical protein